ncbi:MAG TPA: hypothetical protein VM935_09230, partial [Chitinophagaceae bacterium]|nr:hypothetical protein [Chitinophagaceae bacterium]
MNKYSRIFRYIGAYKGQVALYFLFILLSIVFSIVSLGMLMPFLDLIFTGSTTAGNIPSQASNPVVSLFRSFVVDILQIDTKENDSKVKALGIICIIIILSIFLKNLFFYLALKILNPLKNKVV